MSKIPKKALLTLSSFLIAGLLLAGTISVLAANLPFDVIGTFSYDSTAKIYSVGTQPMTVTNKTVCTKLDGSQLACTGLFEKLVEATGVYTTTPSTIYTATAITELGTFVGVVSVKTPVVLTVGSMTFNVDTNTVFSGTVVVGDVVKVTYKKDVAAWLAVLVEPVATSTLTGEVTAISGTEWTVDGQPFVISGDTDIYDNPALHDIVTVTYYSVDTKNFALKIELYAPFKNENSRCVGREEEFAIPNGILKKLPKGFDEAQARAMFCQGFGWGEIVQAFKWAKGDLTPAGLLALKAGGMGWGQIKKEAGPLTVDGNSSNGNQNFQNPPGKPENPGNSENAHNKEKSNNGKGKNK